MLKRVSTGESVIGSDKPLLEPERTPLLGTVVSRLIGFGWVFNLTVALPTAAALLYYGLLASDVYISESRFVVRAPDKAVSSGLGVLLRTAGWGNAGTEVYAARDYVLSRDALKELDRDGSVRRAFGDSHVSIIDRFNPVGLGGSTESLYKYYLNKVSIGYDSTSTITTMQVRAYTPQDAYKFNAFLLRRSEMLVNNLNRRAQTDLIKVAEGELDKAQAKALTAALALAEFRDKSGIVDPGEQATVQLQMISKMQDELIATRTTLAQLRALTPNNPQIPALQSGEDSLKGQIDEQTAKVVGGKRSLAGSVAQYQRVMLNNQFAEKQLTAAMTAYEDARSEALRKQAYVERIVEPNIPDKAQEPRRIRGIVTVLAFGLVCWGVIVMILAGIREHKD